MSKSKKDLMKISLFIIIFVLLDQWTKYLAKTYLMGKINGISLIKNIVALKYLEGGNTGAAWGILSGNTSLLIIFSAIILIFILIFIRNIERVILSNYSLNIQKFVFVQYLLCLLVAGALGNIIDRIRYGSVIDFISFEFIDFPIFNVADMYVSVSCVLITILCLFKFNEKEFNLIISKKVKKS